MIRFRAGNMPGCGWTVIGVSLKRQPLRSNELADEIAKAFARFPYPDSFFSWTNEGLYAFNRADRPPSWPRHWDLR